MTEREKTVRKTRAAGTRKKTTTKKAAKRTTRRTTSNKNMAALSSSEIRVQIGKLNQQLIKTMNKEMTALTREVTREKKRIASQLAKVKKLKDRVTIVRDTYRNKPTLATKTRYARARDAAKIAGEELAETRTMSRALSDQLTELKNDERRERKLQVAIDKLIADFDKPKKRRKRKTSPSGRGPGRPRKNPIKEATIEAADTASEKETSSPESPA